MVTVSQFLLIKWSALSKFLNKVLPNSTNLRSTTYECVAELLCAFVTVYLNLIQKKEKEDGCSYLSAGVKAQEVNPGLDRLEEVHHSSDLGDVNALMSTGDPRAFKSSHQLLTEEYHQHQVCKLSLISTFQKCCL